MYGLCAEVFEDDLAPFVPRILKNIEKLILLEGTNRLHAAISETLGSIVFHVVPQIPSEVEKRDFYEKQFLAFCFTLIEKSGTLLAKNCGILCLSKIIINCADDVLHDSLESLTDKILSLLKTKSF